MYKVSVIVPAYNAEAYLRQCLESIVSQTLNSIQIICVNDGSKDGTAAILKEYADRDSRVLVVDKPNTGYGNSMNVGLAMAEGEYIGIVESDDFIRPEMYQTLYEIASAHDLDFIKADFISFMESEGKRMDIERKLSTDPTFYRRVLDPRAKENRPVFRFAINTWSGIYKKAFLERFHILHNETPGASYQDNGFWFQTFCHASRGYFLDKPLYMNRRDNPNSSVHSKEKVFCMNEEYAYIRGLMKKDGDLESFLDVCCLKKFHNYMFTFNRVALDYKLMFIRRFAQEFIEAEACGELCLNMFSAQEKSILRRIMGNPDLYYMERMAGEARRIAGNGVDDVNSILQASRIYKTGMVVTYLPRKARDLLRSLRGKLAAGRRRYPSAE